MPSPRELLKRAVERQKARERELLARVNLAFRLHPKDVAQGLPRLIELGDEIVARLVELVAREAPASADAAVRELVGPVLAASRGGAALADGWERGGDGLLDLTLRQGAERLEEARDAWLSELRRQLEEADLLGWDDETTRAAIADDLQAPGRAFGAFRRVARDVVASAYGQAWTSAWLGAWGSLRVRGDVLQRAKVAS